ncbi:Centrosomal protein [Portunus trituberculatus]|uniref:Centrosomal protein n=1 Tax=Portunus trituberculatus TaxID=210409 RepID=A0A5B7EHY1_PORTR|nr:Centrosomal protein [Portunus trituberculatus]
MIVIECNLFHWCHRHHQIRSVSYTPRRQQPVSRGSVRVVSSHAQPSQLRRRQEEAPAFLREGLGSTYTLRSGQRLSPHSPSSSDSDLQVLARGEYEYSVPPMAPEGRGGYWGPGGGREDLSRVTAGDTTSNEDSESTVMSLGRRIQLMAATGPGIAPATAPAWDTEWRTLLQQNHQLLLRLSSREDLRAEEQQQQQPDTPRSAPVQDSAVQTLLPDAGPEPPILSGSEAGEEVLPQDEEAVPPHHSPECVLEDIVEESSLSDHSSPRTTTLLHCRGKAASPPPCTDSPPSHSKQALHCPSSPNSPTLCYDRTSPGLDGEESVHFLCKSPALPQDSFQGPLSASPLPQEAPYPPRQSPSSVGQDTDYLWHLSLPPDRLQGGGEDCPLLEEASPHPQHCSSPTMEHKPQTLKHVLQAEDTDTQNRPSLPTACPTTLPPPAGDQDATLCTQDLPTRPSYTDSSCTADLPSYRAGAVTTFIMRSRFSGQDKPALLCPQPSKDLLEALRMIEDEEKSATVAEPPERDWKGCSGKTVASSAVPSSPCQPTCEKEGAASLPVLQVLAEKVFLFTQDLVERWNLVEHSGRWLCGGCIGCWWQFCERLDQRTKQSEKRHADRVKATEERHSQELRSLKERLTISEQERREKWTVQKTRAIRESTHRSLETKLKDMGAKHRDEVSLLKAQHWEALREAEEKHRATLQAQEEELKRKFEEEKEEACRRERDREQQRLDLELRQSEQLSLGRLEAVRRQQEKDLKALIEEHQAALDRMRQEAEAGVREAARERDRMKEEMEDKLRSCTRKYEEEMASLQEREERSKKEWREQFTKQETEARQQAERELRERLKRQRDKEIDRAIREIQAETAAREEEQRRACDAKMKKLRERYEAEMQELECGERAARTRYLEMKSLLTQKEEEIVYLRARLHTQDLELCDLQQVSL